MKTTTKSAFTLLELLVVIAIIAILAALAITNIPIAIERGKAINDANQLKSLGQIMEQYLNDHNDDYPALTGSSAGTAWPQQFHKIVNDYKIFASPFDRRQVQTTGSSPVSYGINANVFDTNRGDANSPSELFVMAPLATVGANLKPIFNGQANSNVTLPVGGSHGVFRITKTQSYLNVLFGDSHVLPLNWGEQFKDSNSSQGKKHWVPDFTE